MRRMTDVAREETCLSPGGLDRTISPEAPVESDDCGHEQEEEEAKKSERRSGIDRANSGHDAVAAEPTRAVVLIQLVLGAVRSTCRIVRVGARVAGTGAVAGTRSALRGIVDTWEGRLRRGRFELDPAVLREVDLDPRVRVLLLDDVRVARRVVGARRESFDEPRWYAGLAEHDDHRGGEVLAEVLPQIEEEVLDRVLPGRRRLHLGRVRIRRAPQEGLQGLRFVVCIWDVVQKAVSEFPHSRRHGRWQLQVLRL